MRAVLDTNILISALLTHQSVPATIIDLWDNGAFELIVSEMQIEEFRRVSRYTKIRTRIVPSAAGELVAGLRKYGISADPLPQVDRSPDPFDNYLLAMAEAAGADYLVTGDKADLLALERHAGARTIRAREFLTLLSPR